MGVLEHWHICLVSVRFRDHRTFFLIMSAVSTVQVYIEKLAHMSAKCESLLYANSKNTTQRFDVPRKSVTLDTWTKEQVEVRNNGTVTLRFH